MDVDPDISVNKKCKELIKGFEKIDNIKLDVVRLTTKGCFFNKEQLVEFPSLKWQRWLFINTSLYKYIWRKIDGEHYDFLWIRAPYLTGAFINLLRKIKTLNKDVRIVLEYGSYPYFKESFGVKKVFNLFDLVNSSKLSAIVDRIITYCGQKEIYNVPTIKLSNGIDVSKMPVRSKSNQRENNITFISVSSLLYWHGIDRFIIGIGSYLRNQPEYSITFLVVGQGPEIGRLKNLVISLGLRDSVLFLGIATGKDLNKLFNESDIGVGTLGMHRKNLQADSSLKNREYIARGLPFILATPDQDFPPSLPFIKYIPADDSPVDIPQVINFYKSLQSNPEYKRQIRKFAEEHLDWRIKINQVLTEIELN